MFCRRTEKPGCPRKSRVALERRRMSIGHQSVGVWRQFVLNLCILDTSIKAAVGINRSLMYQRLPELKNSSASLIVLHD